MPASRGEPDTLYEYKRRFQTHGLEGLKDLPQIAKSHPMSTPEPVVQQVLELALEHPAWGCNRVSDRLSLQGVSISPPTVKKIWNERQLGSRYKRWLALEQHVADRPLALTAEQVQFPGEAQSARGAPYELYLVLKDVEHRRTQVRPTETNGFVERFNRTVLEEFFQEVFRKTFYESVEALQQDLHRWLVHYNTERPHQGYRNQGRRPIETIELYLSTVPEAA